MTGFGVLRTRLLSAASRAEPRGLPLGTGRTLLALAQLLNLTFSPDTALFPMAFHPDGMRCSGVRGISLWCVSQNAGDGPLISRIVTITVLIVVVSGYRPKITCIPHWYVAFSMSSVMPVADGGDNVLQIATMLLIPLCLGDDRVWHWSRVRAPMPAVWRGVAFAAQAGLRLQLSAIYLTAAFSKLMDPLWRQGSALYVIAHHPFAGLPPWMLDLIEPVLDSFWMVAAASWLTVGVQVLIAALIWGGARARTCALVLGTGLHAGIALLMNLPAFGLAMIGVLVIVGGPPRRATPGKRAKGDVPAGEKVE